MDRNESWKKYLPKDGPRKDNRSDYLKARAAAGGQVLNFCPYGCEDHVLDDRGYCKHMVGITHQPAHEGERPTKFSPLKYARTLDGTIQYDSLTTDNEICPVLKTDELIRISVDCMVYRKNPGERQPVKRHKIPDKMMTVLGVTNDDGDVVPATLADMQGHQKAKKPPVKKKKVQPVAEMQPA